MVWGIRFLGFGILGFGDEGFGLRGLGVRATRGTPNLPRSGGTPVGLGRGGGLGRTSKWKMV